MPPLPDPAPDVPPPVPEVPPLAATPPFVLVPPAVPPPVPPPAVPPLVPEDDGVDPALPPEDPAEEEEPVPAELLAVVPVVEVVELVELVDWLAADVAVGTVSGGAPEVSVAAGEPPQAARPAHTAAAASALPTGTRINTARRRGTTTLRSRAAPSAARNAGSR